MKKLTWSLIAIIGIILVAWNIPYQVRSASQAETNSHESVEQETSPQKGEERPGSAVHEGEGLPTVDTGKELDPDKSPSRGPDRGSAKEDSEIDPDPDQEPDQDPNKDPNQDPNQDPATEDHSKTIYLTFDDGPSTATDSILDTLKQYHVKATFFMLEPHMKKYPDLVKRIVEEGHAVGMHGVTHDKNKFYRSAKTALAEMTQGQATLKELTGVESKLIRTPYGSVPYLLDSYRTVLDEQGFKLWDWNVDSDDWALSSQKYVSVTIKQIEKLAKGGVTPIVLMHDKVETAKYLSQLLDYLSQQHYAPQKLDEKLEPYHFSCHDRCKPLKAAS